MTHPVTSQMMTTNGFASQVGKLIFCCLILSGSTVAGDFNVNFWPTPLKVNLGISSTWGDAKVIDDCKRLWKDDSVTLNATASQGREQWGCFAKRNGFYYHPYRAFDRINLLPNSKASFSAWLELLGWPDSTTPVSQEDWIIYCEWSLWNGKHGKDMELLKVSLGRKLKDRVVFVVIRKGKPVSAP